MNIIKYYSCECKHIQKAEFDPKSKKIPIKLICPNCGGDSLSITNYTSVIKENGKFIKPIKYEEK